MIDRNDRRAAANRNDPPTGLFADAIKHHLAGRLSDAVAAYRQVVAINPTHTEALNNMGAALADLKQWDEAASSYRRVLEINPKLAEAHYNLGIALREQGQIDEAVAAYRRAIALKPSYGEAHNNLGAALADRQQWDDAIACYRRALRANPALPQAYNNLGNALRERGQLDEAVAAYRQAIACDPRYAEAYTNLGTVVADLNDWGRALSFFRHAVQLNPRLPDSQSQLGIALRQLGPLKEAIAAFRAALALQPEHPAATAELIYAQVLACDWNDAETWAPRLLAAAAKESPRIPAFFILTQDVSPADQLFCARHWVGPLATPTTSDFHANRSSSSKVRIGYLMPAFRDQVVAMLIPELIERHDRARFEVTAYCHGMQDDASRQTRLYRAFDRVHEMRSVNNAACANEIYADGVDILVDLMGHTQGARRNMLAHRPAPVQVSYLGYPGSMGAPYIDYAIVDRYLVPADQQANYDERLVHLPDCYLPSDSQRAVAERAPTRSDCGLPAQGFVFCCFNNSYKIRPAVFDIWMRLLRQVAGSVLWLVRSSPLIEENLRREAAIRNIAPERLVFADFTAVGEYLARLRLADLFLDTLPYNAGATANDALWAGLPLLTCSGETYVSRMAGSQLRAAGLPELIAGSLEEYEAVALRLAQEPERLAAMRAKLQDSRSTSPLFDTGRYTKHLEAAYQEMWDIWRRGDPPRAFAVDA